MFYLTTHSTHFIYGYMASDIMVKDHSDSEKGNPLPPLRLLLLINSNGSFICIIHVTPVVEHWLEREIAQWVHPMKDRSDDPPRANALPLSYVPLPAYKQSSSTGNMRYVIMEVWVLAAQEYCESLIFSMLHRIHVDINSKGV